MNNKLEDLSKRDIHDHLIKLEEKLNGDVLTILGEIVSGVESHIKFLIEDLCKDEQKHDKLFVILTTPGGSLMPVERMVNIFRHFYNEVNFIIPDYAFSAGTILCMSADNIYMNYFSCLGPIDPQVQNKEGKLVPALGYLDKITDMLNKAKKNELSQAEFLILKDFDLADLRSYEQAKMLTVDLLKQWLAKYKFKDWKNHKNGEIVTSEERIARAEEIAQKLSDNKMWNSHTRLISYDILTNQLKLKIENFEDDKELNNLINEYYGRAVEYVNSHSLRHFFNTRLYL